MEILAIQEQTDVKLDENMLKMCEGLEEVDKEITETKDNIHR